MDVETVLCARVVPTTHMEHPRTVPLSIIDNTVLRFALTSAVWYFDAPTEMTNLSAYSTTALSASIRETVHSYPAWAGQLQWLPYEPKKVQRHGRVAITYGSPNDPGIELIIASSSRPFTDFIPDSHERMSSGAWDANSVPTAQLTVPTTLALHNVNSSEYAGLPAVSVQITTFAYGGLSINVRIMHPLADATALLQFVNDWAAVHRAMLAEDPLPVLSPIFDPTLLDRAAFVPSESDEGAINAERRAIARSLPSLRYDWWASANGCPAPMLPATQVPAELQSADLGHPGDPMPWHEWDLSKPVAHYLVYFTPAEVERMYQDALSASEGTRPPSRISRLDALLSFVWRLVIRARGMAHDPELINLAVTIGLRPRVSPPLSSSFLGSPLTLVRVALPGTEIAAAPTLAPAASAIRSAMAQYTPAAVAALLHEEAQAVNPQHIWRAFLGRRHSIVTSWQGLGVYDVDFGGGSAPRYVDATMPSMDGCIQVMEAGPSGAGKVGDAGERRRWYGEPVCLSLHLAQDVMKKLLKDPELRKYRDPPSG